MKIERYSPLSKQYHTMDIDVTHEQLENWKRGMLIQNAMPNIPAEEREFIMTGITPKEWDDLFEAQVDQAEYRGGDYGDDDEPAF